MLASTMPIRRAVLRFPISNYAAPAGRLAFHASAYRSEAAPGLEKQLRDGLKAAMKGKDKAAVTCIKVSRAT